MSTQTAKPPPAPVAAFLSPILWQMETPDRFDMYSIGITLLQMAFPTLRRWVVRAYMCDMYRYDNDKAFPEAYPS